MNSITSKNEISTGGGDLYTRVAIPRSRSFMNVNSQYNLQELFRELKEKEGVESIDDVLKKIISPNGISFNEIKPVYRELLLKLARHLAVGSKRFDNLATELLTRADIYILPAVDLEGFEKAKAGECR